MFFYLYWHGCLAQTQVPYYTSEKNTVVQKCLYTTHHSVCVSCCTWSILKRNEHWKNTPATAAFGHRHTIGLHRCEKKRWEKGRFAQYIEQLKWTDKKVVSKCASLNKSIQIVSNQGIKSPDEISSLMLAKTYVSGKVMQNSTDMFVGNANVFHTGPCVVATQLTGIHLQAIGIRVLRGLKFCVWTHPAPAHFQPAPASQTIPTRAHPTPHFFGLKPAPVWKLLKTHN